MAVLRSGQYGRPGMATGAHTKNSRAPISIEPFKQVPATWDQVGHVDADYRIYGRLVLGRGGPIRSSGDLRTHSSRAYFPAAGSIAGKVDESWHKLETSSRAALLPKTQPDRVSHASNQSRRGSGIVAMAHSFTSRQRIAESRNELILRTVRAADQRASIWGASPIQCEAS